MLGQPGSSDDGLATALAGKSFVSCMLVYTWCRRSAAHELA